jgi:hypothetical protein
MERERSGFVVVSQCQLLRQWKKIPGVAFGVAGGAGWPLSERNANDMHLLLFPP